MTRYIQSKRMTEEAIFVRIAPNQNLLWSHRKPGQRRQNREQRHCHPKLPVQIRTGAAQALALNPLRLLAHSNPAIHGAQGRIRTSVARKERQIYSLLPLTARPPVPNHPSYEKLSLGVMPILPALPDSTHFSMPLPRISPLPGKPPDHRSMHLSGITAEDRSGTQNSERRKNLLPFQSPFSVFISGAGEGI